MAESAVEERLRDARVARLATRDAEGRPHAVPVCFVYDGRTLYTPVDRKPKRAGTEKLVRVRNIEAHAEVALLVDHYEEDWTMLWYILVRGVAALLREGAEHAEALRLLRSKYPQYASSQLLPADATVIRITPDKIVSWDLMREAE
jgi:PPOX class probable F420-dependent enzyme